MSGYREIIEKANKEDKRRGPKPLMLRIALAQAKVSISAVKSENETLLSGGWTMFDLMGDLTLSN